MMIYLGINLALAAVLLFMLAASSIARSRGRPVSFRNQLGLARAVLSATLIAGAGTIFVVLSGGITWTVESAATQSSFADASGLGPVAAATAVLGAIATSKALYAACGYRRLAKVLRTAVTIRRHGRVAIVASSRVDVPCSVRTLRTCWVVLPEHVLGNRVDVRFAVSHELQHHRHGDTAWAWCSHALTILFWANPAVYSWRRWHASVQELACDEALVARPSFEVADYARCLLSVAERALAERHLLATTMTSGSKLQTRIEMLFAPAARRLTRLHFAFAFVVASTLSIGVSGLAAAWTPRAPEASSPTEQPLSADLEHGEAPCEDSLTEMECR